jgi:RNA methyltransferase, TrmH family
MDTMIRPSRARADRTPLVSSAAAPRPSKIGAALKIGAACLLLKIGAACLLLKIGAACPPMAPGPGLPGPRTEAAGPGLGGGGWIGEGGGVMRLGAHSPKLDAVRELRTKRGRREQGRFAVEGATMLAEALAAGTLPEAVYVTERGTEDLPGADQLSGVVFTVPDKAMERLSDLETPPGILAVFRWPEGGLDALLETGAPLALLAGIADPGNAGSLLRAAEIFGLGGAVLTTGAVEPYNPKVVRATMGAIFRIRLAVAEPAEILAAAARHGYEVVVAAREGVPLPEFRFPERPLIAIGHERHGVGAAFESDARAVGIPQPGRGESLNAAAAGAIIFYAFSQQCKNTNLQF